MPFTSTRISIAAPLPVIHPLKAFRYRILPCSPFSIYYTALPSGFIRVADKQTKMSDKEQSSFKPDTNTAVGAQAIGGAISSDVANTGTTKKLATQDNSVVGGKSCERILQPFIFFLISRLTARYPGISFGQSLCRYPYTFGFYFCSRWQSLVAHEVLLWWQGFHAAVQLRCGAISPRAS